MLKAIGLLSLLIIVTDALVLQRSFAQQNSKLKQATGDAGVLQYQIIVQKEKAVTLRNDVVELQAQLSNSDAKVSQLQEELKTVEATGINLRNQVTQAQPKPAAFIVDNLTASDNKVDAGQSVTVMVGVSNTGGQPGTYQVLLQIRDDSKHYYNINGNDITLDAGKSGEVPFTISLFDPGKYVLSVNNYYQELLVQ